MQDFFAEDVLRVTQASPVRKSNEPLFLRGEIEMKILSLKDLRRVWKNLINSLLDPFS
jgi:hypothetical protein